MQTFTHAQNKQKDNQMTDITNYYISERERDK